MPEKDPLLNAYVTDTAFCLSSPSATTVVCWYARTEAFLQLGVPLHVPPARTPQEAPALPPLEQLVQQAPALCQGISSAGLIPEVQKVTWCFESDAFSSCLQGRGETPSGYLKITCEITQFSATVCTLPSKPLLRFGTSYTSVLFRFILVSLFLIFFRFYCIFFCYA